MSHRTRLLRLFRLGVFALHGFGLPALADVRLPRLISDGMVLQRNTALEIWGWASSGERIGLDFAGRRYRTVTEADGTWRVALPPMPAGGPYTLTVTGEDTVVVRDVLLGDVWFCAGQSNMVHMLNIHDVEYATEIAEADHPQIRQFLVPTVADLRAPQRDFPAAPSEPRAAAWRPAVGDAVRDFSVVAYFFAKHLHERQGVPIGIINASVGGTPIEAWMSEAGLDAFPSAVGVLRQNKDTAHVQAINRAAARAPLPPADLGLLADTKWFEAGYAPPVGAWRTIQVPGYWEDQGIRGLDGVVWYRRDVEIPATMAGKPARIFLGRIVDADIAYINGKQIGSTGYQYPQRRYRIPADVLRAGMNTFVVRVTNHHGKGGFVPDKPYRIFADGDTVDLKGTWRYRVGEVFQPAAAEGPQPIEPRQQPAALFNGMVAPVGGYGVKGVLWYHGESNTGQPGAYARLLPALIADWRNHFGHGTLPFLYVQLPGFMAYDYRPSESDWAALREAQRKALAVPHTAMAVAIDLGEWNDIHPGRKGEIGERLALLARERVYGEALVASGPMYHSWRKEGSKIVLSFTETGGGLVTDDDGAPAEFAIAGDDRKFVWANARIEDDRVVVWHEAIAEPRYIRYAWADNPVNPNLRNREGLPASPFETELFRPDPL